MEILIIGNGFDLAHSLPTKYTDFLDFCKIIKRFYCVSEYWIQTDFDKVLLGTGIAFNNSNLEELRSWLEKKYKIRKLCEQKNTGVRKIEIDKILDKFEQYINPNFWIDYISQNSIGDNWTDFESGISKVIISLDSDMNNKAKKRELDDYVERLSDPFLNNVYINGTNNEKTFRYIRKCLLDDLNKLIQALELYLSEIVETINVTNRIKEIEEITPDYVLSFNYTNTYARVYGTDSIVKCENVHGSIREMDRYRLYGWVLEKDGFHLRDRKSNMVLGIDEYLEENRKNINTNFIAFKKYYQRIIKGTGNEYKIWIDEIRKSANEVEIENQRKYLTQIPYAKFKNKHRIYIFGHSLNVTDKDILRDLILNDNVYTTIYYRNKKQYGKQIMNLVKIIGQDELIRRTGGSTKTIEFKQQYDMADI